MVLAYLREVVVSRKEKLIIFCDFLETVAKLSECIRSTHARLPVFTANGSTSAADREQICRRFAQVVGTSVLLCTHIFNQGINLPCANHTILYDVWWNPVVNNQARGRTERPSQTRSVFSVQLLIADTIEDNIWMISQKKNTVGLAVLFDHIDEALVQRINTESVSEELTAKSFAEDSTTAGSLLSRTPSDSLIEQLTSTYHIQVSPESIFDVGRLAMQIPSTKPIASIVPRAIAKLPPAPQIDRERVRAVSFSRLFKSNSVVAKPQCEPEKRPRRQTTRISFDDQPEVIETVSFGRFPSMTLFKNPNDFDQPMKKARIQ